LILEPDVFTGAAAAAGWLAAVPAADGLPTTTAFSQHSFIYNIYTPLQGSHSFTNKKSRTFPGPP